MILMATNVVLHYSLNYVNNNNDSNNKQLIIYYTQQNYGFEKISINLNNLLKSYSEKY